MQDTASIPGFPRTDGTHARLLLSRPEHDSHSCVHPQLTTIQRCSQEDDAYRAITSTSGSSQVRIADVGAVVKMAPTGASGEVVYPLDFYPA